MQKEIINTASKDTSNSQQYQAEAMTHVIDEPAVAMKHVAEAKEKTTLPGSLLMSGCHFAEFITLGIVWEFGGEGKEGLWGEKNIGKN